MTRHMARHRARRRLRLWILPALLIPLAIASYLWTSHARSEGETIASNVSYLGADVSGMPVSAFADLVSQREQELMATEITIDLGALEVTAPAWELGFEYSSTDTVQKAVDAQHGDSVWDEFTSWIRSPFTYVEVGDEYTYDRERARMRLESDDLVVDLPIEPRITNESKSYLYVVPGLDGHQVDVDTALDMLEQLELEGGSQSVSPGLVANPPSVTDESAQMLAWELNSKTAAGIVAAVNTESAHVRAGLIRDNIRSSVEGGAIRPYLDELGLHAAIESVFEEPVGPPTEPVVVVVDGEVVVEKMGVAGPVCCTPDSVAEVAPKLLVTDRPFYRFDPRPEDDPDRIAMIDGTAVTEVVGEFTTFHRCCENRVVNIQKIADAVTGFYMMPGETLSINEFVGPRTRANGYLPAGAISGGYMTTQVGGGISQFATTLFNAAFFAGLELDEYRSHSLYFSRYPYGREATLSIPSPDLVITNTTDYPVLIWPTYHSRSITVTLYSTKHIEVTELEQRISRRRLCRYSEIDRERVYPDGRVVIDTITAFYRPGNGLSCSGNPL